MSDLLCFAINAVLGGFSIYGAVLLGRWVIGRGWHWVGKFIALLFVASLVVSGVSLVLGGAPDDLRIFTELLASAGAIVAATSLLARRGARRNPWVQYGVPVALLVFLALTWREQISDLRHGTLSLPTPPAVAAPVVTPTAPAAASLTPTPAPTVTPEPSRLKELCDAGQVAYSTCHKEGYK